MKKLLWKILLRLSPSISFMLKENEVKARKEWLLAAHGSEGLKAYYATRYYGVLQALAGGIQKDHEYYINIGRRLELLHLLADAKQEYDWNQTKK